MELLIRFVLGGALVSMFSLVGDVLKPKSFAGLFAAAPSVAMASLALTTSKDGVDYAAIEARSMVIGALALVLYARGCIYFMATLEIKASRASVWLLPAWLFTALAGWAILLW